MTARIIEYTEAIKNAVTVLSDGGELAVTVTATRENFPDYNAETLSGAGTLVVCIPFNPKLEVASRAVNNHDHEIAAMIFHLVEGSPADQDAKLEQLMELREQLAMKFIKKPIVYDGETAVIIAAQGDEPFDAETLRESQIYVSTVLFTVREVLKNES